MLGKLLVTLIVGAAIYFLWRNQQMKNNTRIDQEKPRCLPPPYDQVKPPIKLIFSGALGVIILVTAAWMVYDWKDQRTLLEVQIITSTSASNHHIGTYQVYKKDLQERGFITKDGQIVRIASNERMEVRQLESN